MSVYLGIDTSNYTTSAAVFDGENGENGENAGRLLDVPDGTLGLRQSDALFQHVRRLPGLIHDLRAGGYLGEIAAVGASTRPRAVAGSYMPCFLAGEGQGRTLADVLGVPFVPVSHQQGHLAAAAWSAGRLALLDAPFLAWHLSGGTTELLHVSPEGTELRAERIGGTSDLSAGQLIDRTGKRLGLAFPAGRALDELSAQADGEDCFPVKLRELTFSLSGVENQTAALAEGGAPRPYIARYALNTIADVVRRATLRARALYPGLRQVLNPACGALFAQPRYCADNAMGVAILACRHGKGAPT